ncbi:virulence-associated E family protein [Holdemania massiliensis]|uniref:virulence-associated E family protein n=1 Tax=Holdemania massiliensis TaxID=1468449 RepID=UPI0026745312|nr:virulence-associated E family protein [Holdemania massiliensis]
MLKIATGASRKAKKWKNIEISWNDLCKKLSETYRTRETMAEYAKLKKPNQDEIKDVGGFVGGWLAQGQRKSDTVLCRTVLTLDVDNALPSFWDDLTLLNDYACCIYSTHKHKPEAQRVRLIIPLAREVSAEEYEAIARWVAKELGIDQFDDTTYQASRLMYWPSTSKDGEFIFNQQDGPFLDPDVVLANYPDWHDVSFWPQSSRVTEIVHKQAKRQGDPLTKEGLIGAFCRTYSIDAAIETFLNDVYLPCNLPGRYTYAGGSTAAGLVLYDDKFAYSNHGTDPASGKLCNAFDLVRIHKFGDLDDDAKVDTPVNKLPSYLAMMDMAAADPEVKLLYMKESISDFDDEDDAAWMNGFELDGKQRKKPTRGNIELILRNDKELKHIKGYNTFAYRYEIDGPLPWDEQTGTRRWEDNDDAGLRSYLEKKYDIDVKSKAEDALSIVMNERRFSSVLEYLEPLEWDGVARIETLLVDYLGAEDSAYTREAMKNTLVGAVARIYRPGCKMDNALVLIGLQGLGKSTFIRKLARREEWYTDSVNRFGDKDSMSAIQGKWIVELAELAGMAKAEVEAVKAFISSSSDSFRKAYRRNDKDYLRQSILIGSTNNENFIRDATGGRRFWPVKIGIQKRSKDVFKDLDQEIDQIWAEAKFYFLRGDSWFAQGEFAMLAAEKQRESAELDSYTETIKEYLDTLLPADWYSSKTWTDESRVEFFNDSYGLYKDKERTLQRDRVSIIEVGRECFGLSKVKLDMRMSKQIADAMRKIEGWEYRKRVRRPGGNPSVGFVRIKKDET